VAVVDVAGAADVALADEAADGVNDGLRPLLAADVPLPADATESADAVDSDGSASAAVPACWLVCQPLSAEELTAGRLPCPLSPREADESADRPFALPIVSAGSGTSVLNPACVISSSAESADSAISLEAAVSSESPNGVVSPAADAVSPAEEEPPLTPPDRRPAPERELPDLLRDDDMMPLSTIVSVASPSGSAFRLGGAMISGG